MATYTATANTQVTANLSKKEVNTSAVLAVGATTTAIPKSIQLRYLGVGPSNQTNNVATKRYSDNYFRQNSLVDQEFIDYQKSLASINLLVQDDVATNLNALDTNGNRVYPRLTELSTRAGQYANSSVLGVANGIARANDSGALPLNNTHPNIITDNRAVYYNCVSEGIVYLTNSQTVTGNSPADYRAATFTITDPGFAYYPMNFVYIQGQSSGLSTTRNSGTNNMGRIAVAVAPKPGELPTNIFAQGTCMPTPYRNWHMALPSVKDWKDGYPVRAQTGTTALRGNITLNLYLSNYQGSGYTFYGQGLTWFVVLFPTNTATVSA